MELTLLSPGIDRLRELAEHWSDELEGTLRKRGIESVEELVRETPPRLRSDVPGEINVHRLASMPFFGDTKAAQRQQRRCSCGVGRQIRRQPQ